MILLQYLMAIISVIAIFLIYQLIRACYKLHAHPYIEKIEIAEPSIADGLNQLIADISKIAGVTAPPLFIRRAALPNAFVAATFFKPELYLTDELLEQSSLESLSLIICHEIAHIQRGDAMRLGLLTWMLQLCAALSPLSRLIQSAIDGIESKTDKQAAGYFQELVAK